MMLRTIALGVTLLIGGCQGLDRASASGEATSSDPGSTTATTTTATTRPTTTTTGDTGTDTGFFIIAPDGCIGDDCDVWSQDCSSDHKCAPWANDGGYDWNAAKCVPLDADPKGRYESCTVEGNAVSGVDDCQKGMMCWNVDPDTLEGYCIGFCQGSEANPECEDPCATCIVTNDGVLILCLAQCDPVLQTCLAGESCHAALDDFVCVPDASGPMGAYRDHCEFYAHANVCDAGLLCVTGDAVPGCEGLPSCCTRYCDLQDPACPDENLGVECVPFYRDEPPQSCFDFQVGVCVIPPP